MKQSNVNAKKKLLESEKPTASTSLQSELSLWTLFWQTSFLAIGIAAVMLLITALTLGLWGYGRFRQFLSAAGISQSEFISQVKLGWQTAPVADNGSKNLLVLGTDSTTERGDVPPLTDTMMLVSIDFQHGKINTLPLPRDLWSEAYQTKINALLTYGLDRYPDKPERFPQEVLTEITDLPIHHTVVLSLDQLKTLIDLIGGVKIKVAQGFTDTQYPRAGVDVTTERNPAILYETVTFQAGEQLLTGERAIQYIRSRHSEDEQGHDLARGARQQQVIEAVIAQLTNPKLLIAQPKIAGEVFRFYEQNFGQVLPLFELVSTAKALFQALNPITFHSHQLTDIDDDPVNGVIDNPPISRRYQNQWVYIIPDQAKFVNQIYQAFFSQN